MKKQSVSDRLQQIMSEKNLKQVDILSLAEPYCQKYNVKLAKNYLSQYCNGKTTPGDEILSVLALALDVSPAWLQGYDVPKERTAAPSETDKDINKTIDNNTEKSVDWKEGNKMKTFKKSSKLDNVLYDVRGPVLDEATRMEEAGSKILKLNIGNPAPFGFEAPEEVLLDMRS